MNPSSLFSLQLNFSQDGVMFLCESKESSTLKPGSSLWEHLTIIPQETALKIFS